MRDPQPRLPIRRAVGPRLRPLLVVVLVLFVLLLVNSVYLGGVTLLEWLTERTYQDYTYQWMFLFHLAVGLLLVVPALAFIAFHLRNTWKRPNRPAVYAGLGLAGAIVLLLVSGLLLVRFDFFQVRDPLVRQVAYWAHVGAPIAVIWLFVLHRLSGPRLRWRGGLAVAGTGLLFAAGLVLLQTQDPRQWGVPGADGEADFRPALTRTASGNHIPAESLMMDHYCANCHADVHEQWSHSVHRFASFNNPVYRFAVNNTRQAALERDGNVEAARFCASCHDLVPLLSGRFDDPDFDDINDPTAHAGITCTSCHAITHVNSVRGTGDFTIEEPIHYPFAYSDNRFLQWVNAQLIKARPDFHNRTFLKPLHQSAEFCSTCHKLHLPEELNHYRWLRGQNHYDSFLLSGVSGHGVASFYYPAQAEPNCNACHMPQVASNDFGARVRDGSGVYTVSDHLFPAANTAIAYLLDLPDSVIAQHQDMLQGAVRVDLVALRRGGEIDGELIGPLRPRVPALVPGETYLLQVVLRNLTTGHHFTQGTSDSNEVWVEVEVVHEGRIIARSGGLSPRERSVDPWSHFVNTWMLDREGRRIDRRNAEDIFIPLYDHQIPPGAADLVHYRLNVPEGISGELSVTVRLNYRKFDVVLMRHVEGEAFVANTLPITVVGEDRVVFPLGHEAAAVQVDAKPVPEWERWNDYGIGALRKPLNRQLRQAEEIFARVEALDKAQGALNLARVYLAEGRLAEAAAALERAAVHPEPAYPWSLAWFGGQLLFQEGRYEGAIRAFQALVDTAFPEARRRGFDFSRDYRLLNQLGLAWLESARGDVAALAQAQSWFEAALVQDPENATAHYNLAQLHRLLGDEVRTAWHAARHQRYRVDDNARDRAVAAARRANPAADHAADPVVIYDLQRPGGLEYGSSSYGPRGSRNDEEWVSR